MFPERDDGCEWKLHSASGTGLTTGMLSPADEAIIWR